METHPMDHLPSLFGHHRATSDRIGVFGPHKSSVSTEIEFGLVRARGDLRNRLADLPRCRSEWCW